MGIKKKKISELPLADTLVGLHTIGVNALNRSAKVELEFLATAADTAYTAAAGANAAAQNAAEAQESVTETITAAAEATTIASNAAANAQQQAEYARQQAEGIEGNISALQATDAVHQESLTNAHNDIGAIREMLKSGATLAEAKTALVALGDSYKDLYAVANTLKVFLSSSDTADSTINTWREIETFLQGITDAKNLTTLLNELEAKVTAAYTTALTGKANTAGTYADLTAGTALKINNEKTGTAVKVWIGKRSQLEGDPTDENTLYIFEYEA